MAFTRDGENAITKYSDYIPKEIAPLIEVKTVEKSLAELLNDQQKLAQSAEAQGIGTLSWVNLGDNRVEVNVKTSDKSAFDLAVNEGKIVQPDKLKINLVRSLIQPMTDVYGGLKFKTWLLGGLHATSGFSVIEDGTTEGVITAGHADNGLWYGMSSLTYGNGRFEGSQDVQWHTHSGLTFTNEVQEDDEENTREITAVKTRDQQTTYAFYGKYGQATGYTAGQLESKVVRPEGEEAPLNPNATWMLVTNYFDTDDLIGPGDSGGPWFVNNYALGISSFSCEYEEEEAAIYMAISYIDYFDLEVMTE